MKMGWEISEGIFYGEFLLVWSQIWVAFGGVWDCCCSGLEFRQGVKLKRMCKCFL